MKKVLNIGSGSNKKLPELFNGWQEIRLDIDPKVEPDIVADVRDMSAIEYGSIDAIYASHILEHLYYHEAEWVLMECFFILKPTGFLWIEVPDLQAVCQQVSRGNLDNELYRSQAGPIAAIDMLYGFRLAISQGNEYMAHKTGFDSKLLEKQLEKAKFDNVQMTKEGYNLIAIAHKEQSQLLSIQEPVDINQAMDELQEDFDAIAMARPPFVLEKFVVGNHDHPAQQWAHCVLEMRIKYDALRRAKISRQILEEEIKELEASDKKTDTLEADLKRIDIEEQDRAVLGAMRELKALYEIYQRFERRYSREELNEFQAEYWRLRLTRQANQDLLATGHIGQSNLEALQNIGLSPPLQNEQIGQTEQQYLSQGNRRLLVVVPTEEKAVDGLPVLEKLIFPGTIEYKLHNIYGMQTERAYNEAVFMAIREGCDYLLTVEDDTFPPSDGLVKLLNHRLDIVGGWYPMRQEPLQGVPIILKDGQRQNLEPDDQIHEVYTIPQGFTLFRVEIFKQIKFPWFVSTPQLSQDSYFSQLAREAGYRLWCDTSIKCKHIDRETGKVYEWPSET